MSNLKISDVSATILDSIDYKVDVGGVDMTYNGAYLKHTDNRVALYGNAFVGTPKRIVRYAASDGVEFDDSDDCIIENMLCETCEKIKDNHFGKHERQQWLSDIVILIGQICSMVNDGDGHELCLKTYVSINVDNLSGGTPFEQIKDIPCIHKYKILYWSLNEALENY